MKKLIIYIIIASGYISCNEKAEHQQPIQKSFITKEHPMIENSIRLSTPIDSAFGDLDNDGVEEKILVFNTNERVYYGMARKMKFFKWKNNTWKSYYETQKGYPPESINPKKGKMVNNSINIEKGILKITYANKKPNNNEDYWHHKSLYKYRFQNGQFTLIGYTMQEWLPCFFKKTIDYNLSTNKVIYADKPLCHLHLNSDRKPESDIFYYKMDKTITLDNFGGFWSHEIISPKYGEIGTF